MGRRKRAQQKPGGPSWGARNKRGDGYEEVVKENPIFEGYYKAQKIVPEEEWDSFIAHMKEPLPTSFRISGGHRSQAKAILHIIQGEYFSNLSETKPECLTWYPDNFAWQLNLSRKDIRKSEANVRLHNFLVSETETGNITRQETVSMIPPLVLDVQSHHKVLDMCAAPGSKTTQLIEMLHSEEGKVPEGFVIANDANNKRCYMLVHQLKRLQSPNVIITNHDATTMPNIKVPESPGSEGGVLKFDRILCDVPCSGDGTLRKNLDVWMKWNTANAVNLHGIQYRIARRGAEMLAVGGKMVYSTCSLNPIEDEAVLHRLLVAAEGSLELEEVSDRLPGLKYSPGISRWVVMGRDLTVFKQPEDVPESLVNLLRPTVFPPSEEAAPKFHFERCLRVLPHQQNTGGFFVAVLKKVGPLPWESSTASKVPTAEPEDSAVDAVVDTDTVNEAVTAVPDKALRSPARKKPRIRGFKEDPYYFLEPIDPILPSIRDFYGISDDLDASLLFSRCTEDRRRNVYFTTPQIRDITKINFEKITIINTGVKMFSRSDNKGADCGFRIAQEGAPIVMNFMSKRRVTVTRDDMNILLSNDDMQEPPEIHKFSKEAAKQFHAISTGSILVEYHDDTLCIVLVAWKGKTSVRAYVPKSDRIHYLRLCGGDVSKFEVNKFARERAENGAEVKSEDVEDESKESEEKLDDDLKDCDQVIETNP